MEGKRKLVTTYNDDDGGGRCTGFGDAGITLQGETVVGVIHFGDHGHVGFVGGTDQSQRTHDARKHRRRNKLHGSKQILSSASSIALENTQDQNLEEMIFSCRPKNWL